jgi:hypothetical protein
VIKNRDFPRLKIMPVFKSVRLRTQLTAVSRLYRIHIRATKLCALIIRYIRPPSDRILMSARSTLTGEKWADRGIVCCKLLFCGEVRVGVSPNGCSSGGFFQGFGREVEEFLAPMRRNCLG